MSSPVVTARPTLEALVVEDAQTRGARHAKRRRRQARAEAVARQRPSITMDRRGPLVAVLRQYREDPLGGPSPSPLRAHVERVRGEVLALESWASARSRATQAAGPSIRRALELLRRFGHLTSLDFSDLPTEDRDLLVTLLALEHRWCYAAAGTTRDVFKVEIGRTGAR